MGEEAERAGRPRERLVSGGHGASELPGITRREREVLALLAEGLTNRQIAERL